jgi:type I restriction enzyme S subunit
VAGPDEWAVIKLSAVSKGKFLGDEHKALPAGLAPDRRFEIREEDFLLTRANTPELVGEVCVARGVRSGLMLCDLVYRLHLVAERVVPDYLSYWLLSRAGRHQIEVDARGSSQSMVKISQGLIRAWTVVLPPPEEQRAIIAFADRSTARLDALVAKVRTAIDRLRELRTALISAAVTGKIDVREEAP